MKRKRHHPEQIIRKLRDADRQLRNLVLRARPTGSALLAVVSFLGDELTMPGKDRVMHYDRCDLL